MKIKTAFAPIWRSVLCFSAICFLVGCEKQTSEAVILGKEHIDAAPLPSETPASSPGTAGLPPSLSPDEVSSRPIDPDEITVDQYVMKREFRGTAKDPRALPDEQWLVEVRLSEGGRTFKVHAHKSQFDSLKEGDRVQVRYQVGKYTGTVWGSEILNK